MHSSSLRRRTMRWGRFFVALFALSSAVLAYALPASADPGNGKANGRGNGNGAAQSSEHSQSGNHQTDGTAGTSGDVSQPQPPSNADQNGTGANTTGPYDSTRDGSPSGNGNGNGNATGKPCAGCVGKADNKNPPGQQPGPQDHNNGYECDGNNGIAKTNPAHTGCKTSTSTPPPCDAAKEDCTPGCDATVEDCTPGCDATVEDCAPGCDATVQDCAPLPTTVLGEQITAQPTAAVVVTTSSPAPPAPVVSGTELPRTGFAAIDTVTIAALLLAAGGLIVATSRRLARFRA